MPGISYLLPLRWAEDSGLAELTGYLRWLAAQPAVAEVIVVDGSPPPRFDAHAVRWRGVVRQLRPDPGLHCANGKVRGVLTGMRHASHQRVIIADDDVRYDSATLTAVSRLLGEADLVRPQNYFDPVPPWALWDTARSLVNRSVGEDYPGTLGVRKSAFERVGGYDGGVLFENLELIRTMRARGCSEVSARGVFVARRPCSFRRFLEQRVQQAYDDLAQPVRLGTFLAVLPAMLASRRRPLALTAAAGAIVCIAEVGRCADAGARVFPPVASLLAPGWVLERAVCSWLAVFVWAARGGYRYRDGRIRVAAHSEWWLRRRDPDSPQLHRSAGAGVSARPCASRRRTA